MKAPLYDVKNKLSEYVLMAQNGEPVEICKHDKPAAYLISCEEFNSRHDVSQLVFLKRLEMLNKRFPVQSGFSDEDVIALESGRKSDHFYRPVEL